jgi:enamine deaminase RidA (YjgF/YER057c/UK114 family)
VQRRIVGFHQDEQAHWVAEFECGHNQHVRHDPPWTNREWVTTVEGRSSHLGHALDCIKCEDPMTRKLISSGSTFEAQAAYSRAVVAGDWVFVAGTTGFDYSKMSISNDLLVQTEQCFKNIEAALKQADASLKDVVRVNYILTDGSQFQRCWPILRKYFGDIRPASTMISAGLADPRIQIEIEVTALRSAK